MKLLSAVKFSLKSLGLLYSVEESPLRETHSAIQETELQFPQIQSLSSSPVTTNTLSPTRLDMIRKLDILDPDFYSVFNDSELHMYFTPPPPRIPIYIWDTPDPLPKMIEGCLASRPAKERRQYDNEFFLYESLLNSRHRVYNTDEALFHYVPFHMRRCADKYRSEVQNIIVQSPEYQRYGGANFIVMWNHWYINMLQLLDSNALFEGNITEVNPLAMTTCYEQSNGPDFCHCKVTTSATPHAPPLFFKDEKDNMDRPWPPWVPFTNFSDIYLRTRHFNLIFVGKMDSDRKGYDDRINSTKQCYKYGAPSVYVQTKGKYDSPEMITAFDFPNCSVPVNMSSSETIACLHNVFPAQIEFDKLLVKSKFGWHHKGDIACSARLSDLFNTLTLPVITSVLLDDTCTPYQCSIPYDALSFYVPPQLFEHCDEVVDELLNMNPLVVEKKLRLLYYYRPYYVNGELSWDPLLKETLLGCLSSSVLTEFNLSMSDFSCNRYNRLKAARMPKMSEVDESPVFVL